MTIVFSIVLVVHALIHLFGVVKAFGFAELPQLTQPISSSLGVLWLVASLLFLAAAGSLFVWPRWWWIIGAGAIVVSMVAIVPSWSDAKVGAVANLIALSAWSLVSSLRDRPVYGRSTSDDVDRALVRLAPAAAILDEDLAHLPPPVQRYLRTTGVVGQPRVHNFRVRLHGRIRNGPEARGAACGRAVQRHRRAHAFVLPDRGDVHHPGAGIPPIRRTVGNDAREGGRARARRRRVGRGDEPRRDRHDVQRHVRDGASDVDRSGHRVGTRGRAHRQGEVHQRGPHDSGRALVQ